MSTPPPSKRSTGARASLGLTVVSQALSSATNAVVSVLGSIILLAADFGALAAALIA